MALKLYMDHNVPRAITLGLRLRNIDVLMAYKDKSHQVSDIDLLNRASDLGRILFTHDDDLLVEASHRQITGRLFNGVIYVHRNTLSIGQCIEQLLFVLEAGNEADVAQTVIFLPL